MSRSFGELFNIYRVKAGFATLSQFAERLAEEGCIYEDSIFSKWKSGERYPRDRRVALVILRVFIKQRAITHLEEANEVLNTLGMRDLDDSEKLEFTVRLDTSEKPFTKYRALREPSALFQNLFPTKDNTKIVNLSLEDRLYVRDYWMHQSFCALAEYYAVSSVGKRTPEEVFDLYVNDPYDKLGCTDTFVAITVDEFSGEEYLSATVRLQRGQSSDLQTLNIFNLIGTKSKWPHEVDKCFQDCKLAELDRFVIANWAWSGKDFIVRNGFSEIWKYADVLGVSYLYAIMSSYMLNICNDAGVRAEMLPEMYPLHTEEEASERYSIAYADYDTLRRFWETEHGVYRFIGVG